MKKYIFLMSKNESRFVDVMVLGNKQEIKIEQHLINYCSQVAKSIKLIIIDFLY